MYVHDCMPLCMSVSTYNLVLTWVRESICLCLSIYVCGRVYTCLHRCIFVWVLVCICVCDLCVWVWVCVLVRVRVSIWVYVLAHACLMWEYVCECAWKCRTTCKFTPNACCYSLYKCRPIFPYFHNKLGHKMKHGHWMHNIHYR